MVAIELGMPRRRSASQLLSYLECGEKYRLGRRAKAPARPTAWAPQGTAVHYTIEQWEKSGRVGTLDQVAAVFESEFDKLIAELKEKNTEGLDWLTGSKKSGEQDIEERRDKGRDQVLRYVDWAVDKADEWRVMASEQEFDIELGGVQVKGYIDQIVWSNKFDSYIVRDLKGLPLTEKIATPSGWTTMGEVEVGDEVFGTSGLPVRVSEKSRTKTLQSYRVRFDDGEAVECDCEHLWQVTHAKYGPSAGPMITEVMSIPEMLAWEGAPLSVELPEPIKLPEADLPIDPYVLGVWLGDGNRNNGCFTKGSPEPANEIRRRGFEVREWKLRPNRAQEYNVVGLHSALRKHGLKRNKHVPDQYLRGSRDQRLDLLRGLMDSDGTYNEARDCVTFVNTNKDLTDAVAELARMEGERVYTYEHKYSGFGKSGVAWGCRWTPRNANPFAAPTKAGRCTPRTTRQNHRRVIKAIDPIGATETACIAVESSDHLYLAGRGMVPTHNTGTKRPETPLQLAVYAEACRQNGLDVWSGSFAMLKEQPAKIEHFEDLRAFDTATLSQMFHDMDAMERAGFYIAQPSNACRVCDQAQWCKFSGRAIDAEKYAAQTAVSA
ncbi:PD-(D/E)XK nuclease family protein [Brevibacterium moorei]|uniref:PD-(D/E)XK nuclease family protein n=1 Tax=Brevibacterium moorei TaxID=2968457 RepID=UPI00211C3FF7|nr:PD-(D/E)XK nuclease family protein [Brevibacterium sp. 68QC2CO]MCQ9385085.1 PD-(D/E)XK nuclease family protein [Brevibacterium sp. 68QC2CO]